MCKMKGGIEMAGMIIISLGLLVIVMAFHSFPILNKTFDIKSEADVFLDFNDDTGRILPILKSTEDGVSHTDVFACMLSGSSDCGMTEDQLSSLAEDFDTELLLFMEDGEVKNYGDKNFGDVFRSEIPLPNGKTGTIGVVVRIRSSTSRSPVGADWLWPIDTGSGITVRHCYGEKRTSKISGRPYEHSGVDLGGKLMDPIYAVDDGAVLYTCDGAEDGAVSENATRVCHGYGNMILAEHGNYYVRYSHLKKMADGIKPGTRLRKGEVIGYMGNTGYSFGVHLDFKVYTYNPGKWGYNANIDPLCMYTKEYLTDVVDLKYAEGDPDCQKSRLCAKTSPGSYIVQIEEEM